MWTTNAARDDREGLATDINDGDLQTDHEYVDKNEELVPLKTLEYIELVVESSVVEFVEDLHPHKRVEDNGAKLSVRIAGEDAAAGKV